MKISTAKDTAQDVYILSVCCLKDDCLCFCSWSLIRLVMVKLALNNVKTFLPLTGLDFTGTGVVETYSY